MHAVVLCVFVLTAVTCFLVLVEVQPSLKRHRRATQAARAAHVASIEQHAAISEYLVGGEESHLRRYFEGSRTVRESEAALRAVEADPVLAGLLQRTRRGRQAWITEWAVPTIEAKAEGSIRDAEAVLVTGQPYFDAYRSAAKDLIDALAGEVDGAISGHADVVRTAAVVQLGLFLMLLLVARRQRRSLVAAVSQPIESLIGTMDAVRRGDLAARPEGVGPAEVRRLAEGFAAVTATLAERHDELAAREAELSTQAANLRLVLDVARRIAGTDDVGVVVEAVGRAAVAIAAAERVVVWSLERDVLVPRFDSTAEGRGLVAPCRADDGVVAEATRRTVVLPVVEDTLAPARGRALLPMTATGRAVGVLDIHVSAQHPLPRTALGALETLATHAAAAMRAASLYRRTIELSHTDPVTSLPNRRRLDADLQAACEHAGRHGRPLAFVMVDIDHFKAFNDTYGHARGDEVLRGVGGVLRAELRQGDAAYRYGGDEFAVLLPETGATGGIELAERLQRALASLCLQDAGVASTSLTASFGVATWSAGQSPRELVDAADRALYDAKRAGRDRAVLARRMAPLASA